MLFSPNVASHRSGLLNQQGGSGTWKDAGSQEGKTVLWDGEGLGFPASQLWGAVGIKPLEGEASITETHDALTWCQELCSARITDILPGDSKRAGTDPGLILRTRLREGQWLTQGHTAGPDLNLGPPGAWAHGRTPLPPSPFHWGRAVTGPGKLWNKSRPVPPLHAGLLPLSPQRHPGLAPNRPDTGLLNRPALSVWPAAALEEGRSPCQGGKHGGKVSIPCSVGPVEGPTSTASHGPAGYVSTCAYNSWDLYFLLDISEQRSWSFTERTWCILQEVGAGALKEQGWLGDLKGWTRQVTPGA